MELKMFGFLSRGSCSWRWSAVNRMVLFSAFWFPFFVQVHMFKSRSALCAANVWLCVTSIPFLSLLLLFICSLYLYSVLLLGSLLDFVILFFPPIRRGSVTGPLWGILWILSSSTCNKRAVLCQTFRSDFVLCLNSTGWNNKGGKTPLRHISTRALGINKCRTWFRGTPSESRRGFRLVHLDWVLVAGTDGLRDSPWSANHQTTLCSALQLSFSDHFSCFAPDSTLSAATSPVSCFAPDPDPSAAPGTASSPISDPVSCFARPSPQCCSRPIFQYNLRSSPQHLPRSSFQDRPRPSVLCCTMSSLQYGLRFILQPL